MTTTRPTTSPITPDHVPREPTTAAEREASTRAFLADLYDGPGTFPPGLANRAIDYASEHGSARIVRDDGSSYTIHIPREDPVHAAERGFLAAYRARRDASRACRESTAALFSPARDAEIAAWLAAERAVAAAQDALDAADAAARDGAK
jgi:hypothetical protein